MHFVEKPGRVPLALCLVADFSHLNNCLIRDQPQVFPTGEKIRQQLGPKCVVGLDGRPRRLFLDKSGEGGPAQEDLYAEYR